MDVLMDVKQVARAVSRLHNRAGAAVVEVTTGHIPRSKYVTIGLGEMQVVPGREISGRDVRIFLWNNRRIRGPGRICVVTWYNDGTGHSELRLGSATFKKAVAERVLSLCPDASLVEVKHGQENG